MAISFFNVRSQETKVCRTPEMIAAYLNSSDRNPNVMQGQDFGWRLAPAVVVKMREVKLDPNARQYIASSLGIPLEDVQDRDFLYYISAQDEREHNLQQEEGDFTEEYEAEIRDLQQLQRESGQKIPKGGKLKPHKAPIDDDVKIEGQTK